MESMVATSIVILAVTMVGYNLYRRVTGRGGCSGCENCGSKGKECNLTLLEKK